MKNTLLTLLRARRTKILGLLLLAVALPTAVLATSQFGEAQTPAANSQPDTAQTAEPEPVEEVAPATVDQPIEKQVAQHDSISVSVERLSGQNALDTSVAVSKKYYKSGASVAYIVERNAFPDAIVAGSMRTKGPILYVNTDYMSKSVAAELKRLKPKKVIIVGGADVVNNKVLSQIKKTVVSSTPIERLSGTSRYDTAVSVSRSQYSVGSTSTVYLTNGTAYPDAIAATQQKAAGPLLYTKQGSVPNSTLGEIKRLKVKSVVIIGAKDVVSNNVIKQIESKTSAKVTRIGGLNRYETAADFSRKLYPNGTDQVFIANGTALADAVLISAIPSSGSMLYVSDGNIPSHTRNELNRLGAKKATLIGGDIRISGQSAKQIKQYLHGSILQKKLSKGVSYFLIAHPDDEITAWSLIQSSEFPVFILHTQGEASSYCTKNGGKGSQQCRDRRLGSFHKFLNNYYTVSDRGKKSGGYHLYMGKDSARLIFDKGDGNLTPAEVKDALSKARAIDYGNYSDNYVATGNYWDNKTNPSCDVKKHGQYMCGLYDHADHRAIVDAVDALNYPNKATIHGSYNKSVNAGTYMGQKTFDNMMHCTKGTYNQAYSWLHPPCWTTGNSLWRSWHWVKDY